MATLWRAVASGARSRMSYKREAFGVRWQCTQVALARPAADISVLIPWTSALTTWAMATRAQASRALSSPLGSWAEGAMSALLLMTGKAKICGKNKRLIKAANHGKRPCNHTARRSKRPRRSHYKG
eukprot:scaffold171559_cov34-Tisochrysis_lutea.AAC.2